MLHTGRKSFGKQYYFHIVIRLCHMFPKKIYFSAIAHSYNFETYILILILLQFNLLCRYPIVQIGSPVPEEGRVNADVIYCIHILSLCALREGQGCLCAWWRLKLKHVMVLPSNDCSSLKRSVWREKHIFIFILFLLSPDSRKLFRLKNRKKWSFEKRFCH